LARRFAATTTLANFNLTVLERNDPSHIDAIAATLADDEFTFIGTATFEAHRANHAGRIRGQCG